MRFTSIPLSESHPETAALWDFSKNGELTPDTVSGGSKKKAWFVCPINKEEHVWETRIFSQSIGGCPFCSGQKVCKSSSLSFLMPEIANEWDKTKNGTLSPDNVSISSARKIWWQCKTGRPDHVWEARVFSRTKNESGCPFCAPSGRKQATYDTSLRAVFPEIAAEWHIYKNGKLTPDDVMATSGKKVWWICSKGEHEYQSYIHHRTKGGRESQGTGCPYCSNQLVNEENNLEVLRPDLAKQWHTTLNGNLKPRDVGAGSRVSVWWKCDKAEDHEWQSSISQRVSLDARCPCCSGRLVTKSNCLAITHPILSTEWHPTKNGNLTPSDVSHATTVKAWWKCIKGKYPDGSFADDHEWEALVRNRSDGDACPCCSNQKIVPSNCLKTTHPMVASQWHPTLNGKLTPLDVVYGSHQEAWFVCRNNPEHVWKTKIYYKVKGGCPICCESKGEATIAYWLDKNKISYLREFTQHECKFINTLSFDFAVFKDNMLFGIIEFHGGQHYKPVEYFGGQKSFEIAQKRDAVKREYCKNNNIPLLEIPYYEIDKIE